MHQDCQRAWHLLIYSTFITTQWSGHIIICQIRKLRDREINNMPKVTQLLSGTGTNGINILALESKHAIQLSPHSQL